MNAPPRRRILVVEDEASLRRMLAENLELEKYTVLAAASAEEAFPLVARERPDLILLDVMLPGESGLDFCKRLRADGTQVPILMLTAKGQESDKVLGLELGADDYVTKPFGLPELLARVKSLLRRASADDYALTACRIGEVAVDFKRRIARRGAKEMFLTHYETELLKFLIRRKGEVLSRNDILRAVWGEDSYPTNRTVDQFVVKLRQKIEKDPKKPIRIQTVHGIGYKFVET